jgi:pimeloyl-ACP methyl ester carboxylesterase
MAASRTMLSILRIYKLRCNAQFHTFNAVLNITIIHSDMSSISQITAPNQFVEVGEIRFAYRKFGKTTGIPLVFLGHFRSNMESWDPMVTDGFAKDRPVVVFSNAGIGLTSGSTPETVTEMARHAILFIEALGFQLVDLLGFSLGGFIAQQITLDRPDLVRRLVLAGTGPEGGQDMKSYTPAVTKAVTSEYPGLDDFLASFFTPSDESQTAGRAFWERRNRRNIDVEPVSTKEVMIAQATAIGSWGTPDEIKQPVLVTNGYDDLVVPTINSYILFKHVQNSKLILYPDSGHGFLFQYAEEFVRDVSAFLS